MAYPLKPHCKRGHEYTEKNCYENSGRRYCRRCQSVRSKRYSESKKKASS